MRSARIVAALLREAARRDDPRSALAYADITGWELAEGLGSDAAAEAIGRKDRERLIPGLPARRTYKGIGWSALAAVVVVTGLAWLPPSGSVDALMALIPFATAVLAVMAAAWSILSEMRGWEGSDAATWHAKARVIAFEKQIEARRHAMRDRLVAIGANGLVIYQMKDGTIFKEAFVPSEVDDLSLESGARHMVLRLTRGGDVRCFDWLPRDAVFETAVAFCAAAPRPFASGTASMSSLQDSGSARNPVL